MTEKFEMVAKTFQGLEGVLADELRQLGAEQVTEGRRVVSFEGDKEMMYRANFCLRTALRVLKPFFKFRSTDADDLYEKVKGYDWSQIMTPKTTFAIDVTAFGDEFSHSRFVTYRVKDAIVDFFMDKEGVRPSIRVTNPDIHLDVHISGDEVTLSLDSSGDPLFKRGWRVAQTDAPINEVLAAGIIKLSGWDGQCDLVDPMCGSGTFLVEAALIALNINPGIFRKQYAFQNWKDYDAELFSSIYNDDSGEREFNHKIYGYDIAPKAIAISKANVKNAGVSKVVELESRDIADWQEAPHGGVLITNPPYGERLKVADMEQLYGTLGNRLKNVFKGYHAWIIGYSHEHFDMIGLKPSVRYPLYNGALECELREYVIFDGTYSDLRERGDHIRNEGFRASDRPSYRRQFKEMRDDGREGGERPRRDAERKPHSPRRGDDERRSFGRRRDDQRRGERRDDERRPSRPRRSHDNYESRDKGPSLGADKEVPIIHGRRKSWKRRDLDGE
ncbi:MAG: RNA methyltransferase [Muribaculaceae bacterium]|nr:RNA methyltransferase [Muribaculaceae bacterium]